MFVLQTLISRYGSQTRTRQTRSAERMGNAGQSEEDRAAISSKRDRFERALRKHLEAGMKTGAFRKMNVDLTARAVLGMCNWAYQWYRPDGPQSSREIASLCWDIAINGLASDGDIPVPQV